MLKTPFTLLITLFFIGSSSLPSYAQSTEQDTFYRSAGIDASFINNFIPFDNTIGTRGNYLFHYIKYDKKDKFTRQAFDIDVFGNLEDNDSDIDRNNVLFNLDYKIGRGKRKGIFDRGYILYGTELLLDYGLNRRSNLDSNDPNESSFNILADQGLEVAIGPFLGLEYKISRRISLYTEAGFHLHARYSISSFRSEFDSTQNFKDTTVTIRDIFDLPGSIILLYSFNPKL